MNILCRIGRHSMKKILIWRWPTQKSSWETFDKWYAWGGIWAIAGYVLAVSGGWEKHGHKCRRCGVRMEKA